MSVLNTFTGPLNYVYICSLPTYYFAQQCSKLHLLRKMKSRVGRLRDDRVNERNHPFLKYHCSCVIVSCFEVAYTVGRLHTVKLLYVTSALCTLRYILGLLHLWDAIHIYERVDLAPPLS